MKIDILNFKQRASACTPNDTASMRDMLIDLSHAMDILVKNHNRASEDEPSGDSSDSNNEGT